MVGFEYLMRANIDPRGLVSFFEKIKKESEESHLPDMDGALNVLSTHPATDKRIKSLKLLIQEKGRSGPYRKFNLDFMEFQKKLRDHLNQ